MVEHHLKEANVDIYTRVENLEKLVDELVKAINNSKQYTDTDIAGARKSISDIDEQNDILKARANDTELVLDDIMTNIIPEIMR